MKTLHQKSNFYFNISNSFKSQFMIPVFNNCIIKAKEEWDDYNEAYHFSQLVNTLQQNKDITTDYHYLLKDDSYVGIMMISYGSNNTTNMSLPNSIHMKQNSIVLNYFHISQEGRGNGEYWLRNIIIPYYKNKGFKTLYVKSSHSKVFSLYSRLGVEIAQYQSISDNNIHVRSGKVFEITL
ncbi:MAG: hypothetical protein ACK5LC_07600 [Coprobacillaceae bacterium]